MQESNQLIKTFAISLFKNARDNRPTLVEISLEQLFNGLSKPTPVPDHTDKDDCRAWSPARFVDNRRSDSNVVDASVLVYDIDKESDGSAGLTPQTLDSIVDYWNKQKVSYLIHSSFSSAKYSPRRKIRVVAPLASPVSPDEYQKLWDLHAPALNPDRTRRHPGGIFFDACVPESEVAEFWCVSRICNKLLSANADTTQMSLFGDVDLNRGKSETDWLAVVRNATEKHHALNQAAFAIGAERTRAGRDTDDVWSLLEQALKENRVSEPVRNWHEAKYTVTKALKDGAKKALESGPLCSTEAAPKLARRAKKELKQGITNIKGGFSSVQQVAATLGAFVPCGALSADTIRTQLTQAAVGSVPLADIASQIEAGLQAGLSSPIGAENWQKRLRYTAEGAIASCDENVHTLLEHHKDMEGVLIHDIRKGLPMLAKAPPWGGGGDSYPNPITAATCLDMARWAAEKLGVASVGLGRTQNIALACAAKNQFDSFADWLEGLQWDGIKRIDFWLRDYAGAADDEYTRLVARKFVLSAVARTFEPNCKVDTMMILCGPQGAKKSQLLRVLTGGEYFCDTLGDISNKDTLLLLEQFVIVEWAEMKAFKRAEAEDVKHFLSSTAGHVRPAYERMSRSVQRRAVIAGTSNEAGAFLGDETGARRFWPVDVGQCKPDALAAVRAQLWAEAVQLHKQGEVWYFKENEESLALAVQEEKSLKDEMDGILAEKLDTKWSKDSLLFVTGADTGLSDEERLPVYEGQLSPEGQLLWITPAQACTLVRLDVRRKLDQMRVSEILKRLKWLKKKRWILGTARHAWQRPGA